MVSGLSALSLVIALSGAQHDHSAHSVAGWVPSEVLERPLPLRKGVGTVHEEVTTSSKDAQAFYDQGLAFLHSFAWIEAARSFHQALRLDARLAMAHLGLSRVYSGLEDPAASRRSLERAQALAAHASERERRRITLRALQLQAIADGEGSPKHLEYRKALDAELSAHPDDVEVRLLRGNAEERSAGGIGQRGGASTIPIYEAVLARVPDHLAAHHYLTHTFEVLGDAQRALKHGEAHARLAPNVAHAQHMYGHDLRRVGRVDEAIAQFEKARKLELDYYAAESLKPEYDWHHVHNLNLLAMCYQYLGQMNKAQAALRTAFDLPKATESFEAWSQDWPLFLLARGRFDDALAAAKVMTGGRWASARALGHAAAASALAAMDRKDEARAELTAAEEQVPHISNKGTYVARPEMVRPYLDVVQGEIMLRSGQRQDGGERLKAVQRTLRGIHGADAWILALFRLERIGAIARDAGDWDLAEYTAGQMREHDPEYAGTHFALGLVAHHRQDRDAACRELGQALKRWSRADTDLAELTKTRQVLGELACTVP